MKLSAPKMLTWILALIFAIVGVLMYVGALVFAPIMPYTFYFVVVAYALLALGTFLKGF
jgi:hypothetical protein